MSKLTDEQQAKINADLIHMVTTFYQVIVPETGLEPNDDNWPAIALAIAIKYAGPMKPDGRGRPKDDINAKAIKHWCRLAEVMHYKHTHDVGIEQARKDVGLPLGTFKYLRKTYSTFWERLKTDPKLAKAFSDTWQEARRNK